MPTGFGLRPGAKAPDEPPNPTGYAPLLDSTLMVMTLLGRDLPGCDAQLLFTDIELRFLTDYAEELGLPPPDHLAAAVLLLAILGGYQNRTHDPPPGHQIMWRGYERMSIATIGYRIGRRERAGVVQNE